MPDGTRAHLAQNLATLWAAFPEPVTHAATAATGPRTRNVPAIRMGKMIEVMNDLMKNSL
jgi:hypothetical protein